MTRETRDKQSELYHRSVYLKNLNTDKIPYEKQLEIKKEQNELYKRWKFFRGINNAMSKENE